MRALVGARFWYDVYCTFHLGNFRDAMVCYQLAIEQQPQQAKYHEVVGSYI